ncbi:hypothetical protein ACN47E_002329 [Coniothyrium glycines]
MLMPWLWLSALLACYAGLCVSQRDKQRRAIEADFHRRRGPSLASMTLEDAWKIQKWLAEQEFPKTLSTGVFFALFKTYGIPSIAKVLTTTGHMTSSFLSLSRRTADTGQLLNNAIIAPPHSKRSIEAIVRTAWLHRGFRRAGKITNDEMLYTLSLFALEGKRWVAMYEWRSLTDLEVCAIGLFWKQIGKDLDISYADLDVSDQDTGLGWLRALERWSCAYENAHMAPHPSNHTLAVATLELLGAGLPAPAQRFAGDVFCYLMGPKLRRAMCMPKPSSLTVALIRGLIRTRKFFIRYLALPRSPRSSKIYIASAPLAPHLNRYPALRYRAFPWYIPSTASSRWKAWLRGHPQPGPEFRDRGYAILELGPDELQGKGDAEMADMIRLTRDARGRGGE